jgi:cyclopropane fatty-acyl-phospholipid synthase-like methyltransferase
MPFFDERYEGTPPWDIGRPQGEFVELGESKEISGSVLDVGCGTGENILYFAQQGFEAWGIDFSPKAIEKARAKAVKRGLKVEFRVQDALKLGELGRRFDCAIDSGLFHTFEDEERPTFARSLQSVLKPQGTYFMLVFSDLEPEDWGGPRRISQEEIHETFDNGWRINYIREAGFETLLEIHGNGGRAWLSSITRL